MSIFGAVDFDDHEQVHFFYDKETGLKSIIAIHNTKRGPALGGVRMWPYVDEQEAVTDVLRLSRGMTYKAAIAHLPLGGGKAVIIGDSHKEKTPELLHAFGKCVESIHGLYITAEDVGMSVEDMATIHDTTLFVVGLPGGSGDPSPFTAVGVYQGIRAALFHRVQKKELRGLKIAVQGLGHVGYALCKLLAKEGAILYVTDIEPSLIEKAVKEFGANAVEPNEIYGLDVDVYAPCALGATINDKTISQFKCTVIAGSANNQLKTPQDGQILSKMNILYAPDYVINAGGLIDVFYEGPNYNEQIVNRHVERIHDTLLEVFHKAEKLEIPTSDAADLIAEERFKNK